MSRRYCYLLLPAFLFTVTLLTAQPSFDIEAYKQFLAKNVSITSEQLRTLYPGGSFLQKITADFASARYADSIDHYYSLTGEEKSLIARNGFMVTERLTHKSFGDAFLEIYKRDLPVFVSTDAILHALHMSYDGILMDIEGAALIPRLDSLLSMLHRQLPVLSARYSARPEMRAMLNDLDIYLTVPRRLLSGELTGPVNVKPAFVENASAVADLMTLIQGESPANYNLFANTCRTIDFSQFTVRGHYTQSPNLGHYFQSMIWLGRAEIYLIAPKSDGECQQTEADIQRQTIDAVLLGEAAELANALPLLEEIDGTIRAMIGESDNVTLPNVRTLVAETKIGSAGDLLDMQTFKKFQNTLREKSYAFQRINSQILMSDPSSPDQIVPASAFMLLGQRFVIDSYVTGNVVYDKIIVDGGKVRRMLPSTLDVLFALGNNAAAQLLEPELKRYSYGPNLSALRYLVDSYEPEFWNSTLYNGWLGAIRSLNPPQDKSKYPAFMQTGAWWQQKMNTQLASWAQLRHDNLLYAKQSYTGGVSCSFPKSMVEPIPEFYEAVKGYASQAIAKFEKLNIGEESYKTAIIDHFTKLRDVAETLRSIAVKLENTPITSDEERFLKGMIFEKGEGCTTVPDGWYPHLFYSSIIFHTNEHGETIDDKVIADVHTAPTDEAGNMVGWVLHAGTGPINLAVVISCGAPDGEPVAYIGPVMSYYEHVSTNFKRLTDEEWKTAYAVEPSFRPGLVNAYLATGKGEAREAGPMLTSGVDVSEPAGPQAKTVRLMQSYPNPFSASTMIGFVIPQELADREAELTVFNAQGEMVKHLLQKRLPAASYTAEWDGTAEDGSAVADGVYIYRLKVGDATESGKMTLVRTKR